MENELIFDNDGIQENGSTALGSTSCPAMTSTTKPTLPPPTEQTPLKEQDHETTASPLATPRDSQQIPASMTISSTTSTPHSNVSYRNAFGGRVKNLDSVVSSVGSKRRRRRSFGDVPLALVTKLCSFIFVNFSLKGTHRKCTSFAC